LRNGYISVYTTPTARCADAGIPGPDVAVASEAHALAELLPQLDHIHARLGFEWCSVGLTKSAGQFQADDFADGYPRQRELDAVADRARAQFAATDQRPSRSHLERQLQPHGDVGKRDGVLAEFRVPRRPAQRREIDDVNEVALFAVRLFSPPERPCTPSSGPCAEPLPPGHRKRSRGAILRSSLPPACARRPRE
jgi:hypothetical protein